MTPQRLGFPVKVLGASGLKSNDARRWQSDPHLRVSLDYLKLIFDYLEENGISMYRMSSDLAPYCTHPDMPQFHGMVRECAKELRAVGARARQSGIRLSFHPSQYVVLNSPDRALVRQSVWDICTQAEILDRMEQGPEAVIVIHVGGAYGDRQTACERWVRTWEKMPARTRARLVLENDDTRFGPADVLWIHERTGVRLVFDYQHFWCFNPEDVPLAEIVERALASWPSGVRPKIHFSSPRTEMRETFRPDRKTGKEQKVLLPPLPIQHGDYLNPFEFATFMREHGGRDFDVMLESKAKDLALLRLRRDLSRFAPDVASRFGIEATAVSGDEDDAEAAAASADPA